MATILASTIRNRVPNGTYGNINKTEGVMKFTAAQVNDVAHVLRLEEGSKLYGLKAFHENLGAATSVEVGFAYAKEEDGSADPDFFGAAATTSKDLIEWAGEPVMFKAAVIMTVTVKGAVANGVVKVIPEYEYVGAA